MAEIRAIVQEKCLPVPDGTVADRLQLCGFGIPERLPQRFAPIRILQVAVAEFREIRHPIDDAALNAKANPTCELVHYDENPICS